MTAAPEWAASRSLRSARIRRAVALLMTRCDRLAVPAHHRRQVLDLGMRASLESLRSRPDLRRARAVLREAVAMLQNSQPAAGSLSGAPGSAAASLSPPGGPFSTPEEEAP